MPPSAPHTAHITAARRAVSSLSHPLIHLHLPGCMLPVPCPQAACSHLAWVGALQGWGRVGTVLGEVWGAGCSSECRRLG